MDSFSILSNAILIKSETAMRHPGPISVTTDSALGLSAITMTADKQLASLEIVIHTRIEFNKTKMSLRGT